LKKSGRHGIFLETAHPAKFPEIIETILDQKIPLPENLQANLQKKKLAIPLAANFPDLKSFLFSLS
jgi:threonine synthase